MKDRSAPSAPSGDVSPMDSQWTRSATGSPTSEAPEASLPFSEWFWSAIYLLTGFDRDVIAKVCRESHDTFAIPERHLSGAATWAPSEVLEQLSGAVASHLEMLKELKEWRRRRKQNRALAHDFVARSQYEAVLGRVRASVPTEDFFTDFFGELNCQRCGITALDAGFAKMSELRKVSLTANRLEALENLPPNLEVLSACGNRITRVGSLAGSPELRHLGLSHNRLADLTHLV
eukprot:RCo035007